MTNNELLLAISNTMDVKLEPLRNEIQNLSAVVRDEVIPRLDRVEVRLDAVETRLQNLENTVHNEVLPRLQNLENTVHNELIPRLQNVERSVQKLEILHENDVLPRLQNIESCYTSTYERYKNSVTDYTTMKQDIVIIKKVVTEHSIALQKIS